MINKLQNTIARTLFATLIGISNYTFADDPVANACPAEGCQIKITNISNSGDELEITWEANFLPDVSRNHIHAYWDTFTAEQVSSDAEANGFKQGDWVPTSDYPTFITNGAMSVANRAESSTICVTASDRDHAVMDPMAVHCVSASASL